MWILSQQIQPTLSYTACAANRDDTVKHLDFGVILLSLLQISVSPLFSFFDIQFIV